MPPYRGFIAFLYIYYVVLRLRYAIYYLFYIPSFFFRKDIEEIVKKRY
jgi:hypothetical protein